MLAGSAADIDKARLIRRRLGGHMRQSGILAAAGLYALEHNRARLSEDHKLAALFAQLASDIPTLSVIPPETNIVMMDIVKDGVGSVDVVKKMRERGVLITEFTATRIRAVTHLDVEERGIRHAASVLSEVMR
jgi:threonine aldolase